MGERFGEYEIEGRVGAGGMAEVYVASRRGAEGFVKRVCLKRVLAGDEDDRDAVKQFQDEARLSAHLHHPGIAAVHDLGDVEGKWFMSMELVDGVDLRSLLNSVRSRGERLPVAVTAYVVAQVAEALAYAHALEIDGKPLGLVHRDVTPSNVLLSIHGEVKLADFGIARSSVRRHRTASGVVKGKVPYMAPEQALGDTLDRRTDLFALGVVLYELLAGRRPHDGATDLETLTNAQRGKRPALYELAPETPEVIASLVARMLSARAKDRPSSAGEVAEVLAPLAASSARRTLSSLVVRARDPRASAPETRQRKPAAEARSADSAGTPARAESTDVVTRGARAEGRDEGPTEVQSATQNGSVELSRATDEPQRSRAVQFAIGFGVAMTLGTLALGVIALALGGDRITSAIAGARARGLDDEPPPIATLAATDPPKPTEETIEPPPPEPPIEIATTEMPPPVRTSRHRTHVAEPRTPTRIDAPAAPGRIAVIVVPFGEVDIDGTTVGRAPITAAVAAGAHTVIVTSGSSRTERHVVVTPGATERVVIDWMEAH